MQRDICACRAGLHRGHTCASSARWCAMRIWSPSLAAHYQSLDGVSTSTAAAWARFRAARARRRRARLDSLEHEADVLTGDFARRQPAVGPIPPADRQADAEDAGG